MDFGRKTHRRLLLLRFLLRGLVIFRFAFVLQHHRGGRHPLAARQQLYGHHVLVHGSVQVLETLDENLVGAGEN